MSGTYENKRPFEESVPVLNRLLALQQYSLANYLLYANPWVPPGGERLLETVRQIAADHQAHACRIGRLIVNRRGVIGPGCFPVRFTAYNDLALDHLAQRLLEHERAMIDEVRRCAGQLNDDPEARRLAEDVLASEERHVKMLTALISPAGFARHGARAEPPGGLTRRKGTSSKHTRSCQGQATMNWDYSNPHRCASPRSWLVGTSGPADRNY